MNMRLWKSAAIAGIVAVLTAVFLLLSAVILSLRAKDPEGQIGVWIFPILIVGGAVAGGVFAKLYGEKSLIAPLAAGAFYILILSAIALPWGQDFSLGNFLLKTGLPLAACMAVGGFLGNRGTSRYGNSRKAAKHAGKMYKGKRQKKLN